MPLYEIQAPDGRKYRIEGPEGATREQVIAAVLAKNPQAGVPAKPESGFIPAARAGFESLKGEAALTAGKLGLMGLKEAEEYRAAREAEAKRIFKPTEEGWTEAPFAKIKELLGGSLPYMAAPVAAGAAAVGAVKALPIAAGAAAVKGITAGLAAGAASAAQFTGSNLARQIEEAEARGEDASLERAKFGNAVAAAIPQAALDVVSLRGIPLIRNLFKSVGKDITEAQAKALVEQGFKQKLADYGRTTLMTAGREGFTEAGQQYLERLQAGLEVTDPAARAEYLESFIGGAVLGGTLAPAGRFFERGSEQALARKTLKDAEDARRKIEREEAEKQEAAEAEKRKQPEYLRDLQARYTAARNEEQALKDEIAALKKSGDPADAALAREKQAAMRDFYKDTFNPIRDEYNAAGGSARFKKFAEEERVAGMTPEDYMLEQITQEDQAARDKEYARLKARLKQVDKGSNEARLLKQRMAQLKPAAAKAAPAEDIEAEIMGLPPAGPREAEAQDLNLYAADRLKLAEEQMFGMATGVELAEYLAQDPKKASRLVETKAQLPGMSRPQSNLLLEELSEQLRMQGQEMYEDATTALEATTSPQEAFLTQWQEDQAKLDEERRESTFDTKLTSLVNTALKGEPTVEVPEGATIDRRGATTLARIDDLLAQRDTAARAAGQAFAMGDRDTGAARSADREAAQTTLNQIEQQGGNPALVLSLRKQQEAALMNSAGLLDDLRSGVLLGGKVGGPQAELDSVNAKIEKLRVEPEGEARGAASTRLGELQKLEARRDALARQVAQTRAQGVASSTAETIRVQIDKERAAYIDAAIKEAAVMRRLFGKSLTQDEALKAALQMQQVFDEWVTRTAAAPKSAVDFIESYERLPSIRDQEWLNSALEAYKKDVVSQALVKKLALQRQQSIERGAPEVRPETTLTPRERQQAEIQAADEFRRAYDKYQPRRPTYEKRYNPDGSSTYVMVDEGKARLVDPRSLEERRFGNYRRATEVLQEQLGQISRGLSAVPEEGRRVESLLRPQYAQQEAARVAEARGETAQTLEGALRRRRDYVSDLIERAVQTRPDLPDEVVDALRRAQDAVDAGLGARDVVTEVDKEGKAGPAPFVAGLLDSAEQLAQRALSGRMATVTGGVKGAREQKGYDAVVFKRDQVQREFDAQQRIVDGGVTPAGKKFSEAQKRKAQAHLNSLETQLTNLNKMLSGAKRPTVEPVRVTQAAVTGEDAKLVQEINDALRLARPGEGAPSGRMTDEQRAELAQQGFDFGETIEPVVTKPMAAAERRELEAQGQRFDIEFGEPAKPPTKQQDLFAERELPATAFARATAKNFENSPPVKKARAAVERGKQLLADISTAWAAKDKADDAKRKVKIAETQEAINKQREVYRETFEAALKKAQMTEIEAQFQKEITAALQSLQAVSKERAAAEAAGDMDAVRLIDVIRDAERDALLQLQADLAKALEKPSQNVAPAQKTGLRAFQLPAELQAAADEWVQFERGRLTKLEDKLKRLQGPEKKEAAKEVVAQRSEVKQATSIVDRAMSGLGLPGVRVEGRRVTPIVTAEEARKQRERDEAERRQMAAEEAAQAAAKKQAREDELVQELLDLGTEYGAKQGQLERAKTDASRDRLKAEIAEIENKATILEAELGTPELTRTQKAKLRKARASLFSGRGVASEKELLSSIAQKIEDKKPLTAYEKSIWEKRAEPKTKITKKETPAKRTERLAIASEALKKETTGPRVGEFGEALGAEDVMSSFNIEGKDVYFSRGPTTNPSTTASIKAELGKVFPDLGRVQIYDSVDALIAANPQYAGRIPANARGFVDTAGNKAFLIAENIDKGRALSVLLHEVGAHIGLKNMLGDAQYNALVNAVKGWEKRNDGSIESRIAQAARARVEAAETPASQVNDELLAYAVEEAVNAGVKPMETKGIVGQWLSRIAALVKRALQKFGLAPKDLTADELVNTTFGAAKMEMQRVVTPTEAAPRVEETGEILFSKKPKYNANMAKAGQITDQLVSERPGFFAKMKENMLGLGFRTQYIDALAPLEKVAGQVTDAVKGMQMMYYLRMYGQRMNFTSLAITDGVPQLVEKKRKDGSSEWVIESVPGVNIKDIVGTLSAKDVIKAAGSADAANRLFTLYMAKLRADSKGYDALNFGRAAAEAELKDIERELASGKLSADDTARVKQRRAHLEKTKDTLPTEKDIKEAFAEIQADPVLREAFATARDQYNEYNRNLLQFMVQTGAMSKAEAERLLKNKDYIPYYRVRGGVAELMIGGETPVRIGNLKDSPHLRELIGGEEPIFSFLDSSVQNTSMLIDMSMRNIAVKNAMSELYELGYAKIRKAGKGGAPQGAVEFKKDGEDYYAIVDTEHIGIPSDLLVKGLAGIPTMFPAAVQIMGIPSRFLRRAITASPMYAFRQLMRDSTSAFMASGANVTPVFSALKQIGKASAVDRRGITGGQVFTGTAEDKDRLLAEMQSGRPGWAKAFSKLEAMSMEADAASRRSQYESYIKQGLSEMEATMMTLESMNFSRRGVSPSMQMLTTLIPFVNAQIQSLDVLYRSFRGQMPFNERLGIREKLITRGLLVSGMTIAYALAMQDDEDYQNATPDQKYNNWFVRIPGVEEAVRIPIPFELGYIFKALPEAIVNAMYAERGADEAKDAALNILRNLIPGGSNYMIPAAMKPLIEVGLGKSFFTGRDLETGAEKMQEPWARYRDTTSEIAKGLGAVFNISPIKIEALVSGYTGGMGLALLQAANFVLPGPESAKAEKRLSELPVIGSAFQPKDAAGIINDTFDRLKEATEAKQTYDKLIERGEYKRADAYLSQNADRMALASLAGQYRQQIGQITTAERQVRGLDISPQEKREMLDALRQSKILVASSVRAVLDRTALQ